MVISNINRFTFKKFAKNIYELKKVLRRKYTKIINVNIEQTYNVIY